jgi:hypothetical protein
MSVLQLAIEQISFARRYTVSLLEGIDPDEWFRMPHEGVTHIAWQVGHLAFAEYRLVMQRVRGVRPEDGTLISEEFLGRFGRQSTPNADPAHYPSVTEIRAVFHRVHEQVMHDLAVHPEADLDNPSLAPHRLAKTKREILSWCSHHEMLHAGEIALLRRLLGKAPTW